MPNHSSRNPHVQSFGKIIQRAPGYQPNRSSHRKITRSPIFNIDNDSLLNVFYFYRLLSLECDDDKTYLSERSSGGGGWAREHWWRTLVRVTGKWRQIIFAHPSYLDLCIAYTIGKPIAHILAHPPFHRLPLVIEHIHCGPDNFIPPEYKQEIALALKQYRHRLRRICLNAPYSETVFRAIDGEFPILESLYLTIQHTGYSTWVPPTTLQTPRLRQVVLKNILCPLRSLLLTPPAGLVTLSLTEIGEVNNFSPDKLLEQLSLMPRLEVLRIGFGLFTEAPAERMQTMPPPIRTRVKLPRLRQFQFNGKSAYLVALLPRISTGHLEKLQIYISNWQTNSIPYALGLMNRSEDLRSHHVNLMFLDQGVFVKAIVSDGTKFTALSISFRGEDFTWQVASAAYFFHTHRACFYTTRHLTIHCRMPASRQQHAGPDHMKWRRLFSVFCNVIALLVYDGRHGEISRSLQINNGESGMELFPSLKKFSINPPLKYHNTYAPFINARKLAGHPVHVYGVGNAPLAVEVAIGCEAWEAHWLWGSFRLRLC